MNISIDDDGAARYVTVDDDCADAESWQQVGHVICRAAIETLSALRQAGIDFSDVTVIDNDMQFMFTFRVNDSESAQRALGILRDELQTALKGWQQFTDPGFWLPDSTETN